MSIDKRINTTAKYVHNVDSGVEPGSMMLAGRGFGESYDSLRDQGFTPAEIAAYKRQVSAAIERGEVEKHVPILAKHLR